MKIGIITFHWATNYGAVLQAYALQKYLLQMGHDVMIIDYAPEARKKTIRDCFRARHPRTILRNICEYLKERKFQEFRRKYLCLSDRYSTYEELKENPPSFDAYICGSDQIWHYTFTERGENKPTYAYFLDFGIPEVKRIAYAASFGCIDYPDDVFLKIVPRLSVFNAISVREKSGLQLCYNAGIESASLVPDPSLLLSEKDYDRLLPNLNNSTGCKPFSYFYVLHNKQSVIQNIKTYFTHNLSRIVVDSRSFNNTTVGIEQWLSTIKTAEVVVTNSFHGVVFSILFRKNFIVTLVEGEFSGMNDRVFTLLQSLGLQHRILKEYDEEMIIAIEAERVNWEEIERKINCLRGEAQAFLNQSLA